MIKHTSERMLIAHGLPFGLGGSALYNTVIDSLDLKCVLAPILKAACSQNVLTLSSSRSARPHGF